LDRSLSDTLASISVATDINGWDGNKFCGSPSTRCCTTELGIVGLVGVMTGDVSWTSVNPTDTSADTPGSDAGCTCIGTDADPDCRPKRFVTSSATRATSSSMLRVEDGGLDSADAAWEPCCNWDRRGRFDAPDNLTAGGD